MGSNTNITNILICGVGGQGVLTLAEVLAKAALSDSLNVRVGEIHGMAQRGGHVVCTVRVGKDVFGPIVDPGTADIIVGFEPLETLREVQYIRKGGSILMNTYVQYPVAVSMGKAEYPDHDKMLSHMRLFTDQIVEFDAMELAKQAGSPRAMNMVMLGAILGTGLTPITKHSTMDSVRNAFPSRFESINIAALELGFEQTHKK